MLILQSETTTLLAAEMLTVKVFRESTGLAFIVPRPFTGVTVTMATHTGELVVMQVGPWRAVCVSRDATQHCVWIQHEPLLALGALVCLWTGAAGTSLVALCAKSNKRRVTSVLCYGVDRRGCDQDCVVIMISSF